MDEKTNPFENKGESVSDEKIKEIVSHDGGKWSPKFDHTKKQAPPENLKGE